MEANAITLHCESGAWWATYVGPDAAKVVRVFGTSTLSTAFTSDASPDDVIRSIRNLNPGVVVGFDRKWVCMNCGNPACKRGTATYCMA